MIFDKLTNLKNYSALIPYSDVLLKFLNENDLNFLSLAKHQILEDKIFVIIQEYDTQLATAKLWETHKKYIDIQIVLENSEYIGFADVDNLIVEKEYDIDNDITFYKNKVNTENFILAPKNFFVAFFTNEAHKPGAHLIDTDRQKVKKAVFKILR